MSRARRHLRGAFALTVSQAVSRLLALLALILVQKQVSVAENGLFQLGYRLGYLLALFTEFGIRGYVVREVARRREDRQRAQSVFGDVVNLRFALIGPVLLVGLAIAWLAGYSKEAITIIGLFYVYWVLDSFAILFKFVFRAYERMGFDAVFTILGRLLLLLGLAVLWHRASLQLPLIGLAHISSAAIEALLLALCVRWLLGLHFRHEWDWESVRQVFRRSVPFAVINLIGTLYMSTGTIALSQILGEEAVGYYNAAARLPEALQFLPIAVVNALIPFLSRHHEDRGLVRRYYEWLTRYLGYVAVSTAVVFVVAPEWVIQVVAKKEYLAAAAVFRWYGIWLVFVYYQIVAANVLICMDAEKVVMTRAVVAVVLNAALNIVAIAKGGVAGAAGALVVTELVSAVLYAAALARRGVPLPWGSGLRWLVVAVATGGPIVMMREVVPQTAAVVAGVASGAIAMGILAWRDDRELVARIVGRSR